MADLVFCAHCRQPARGHARVAWVALDDRAADDDQTWLDLCHPEQGMDCYQLVVQFKHPTPCSACIRYVAPQGSAPPAAYEASRRRFGA